MKTILTIIVSAMIIGCAGMRQALPGEMLTEKISEVPGTKLEIYSRALQWVYSSFNSGKSVLEMQDSALGVITGNAVATVYMSSCLQNGMVQYSFKIDVKDGKIRFTANNYRKADAADNNPDCYTTKATADAMAAQIAATDSSLVRFVSTAPKAW